MENLIVTKIKMLLCQIIWVLSKSSGLARFLLRPIGLRTKYEWYKGRIAKINLVNGKPVKLTNLDKSYMAFRLSWDGWKYYEPIATLLLVELLKDKKTFLDIGANVGYFSMLAASENSEMQVISFEPDPSNFSILSENIRLSGFKNIKCEKLAIADKTGTQTFYVGASNMQGTLAKRPGETYVQEIPVNAVSLDNYLNSQILKGNLLIKTSGGPYVLNIIRGAVKTLNAHKPDILLEVVTVFDPDVIKILKDCGYSFYQITDEGFYLKDDLKINLYKNYRELFHLVTTRDSREVSGIFEKLKDKIKTINLEESSYILPKHEQVNVLKWSANK